VVVVGGVVGEDTEEEPAEAGAVDDDPRRHGRPGGRGGGPRVRVVRGAEAAGPCTHLTPLICGSDTHENSVFRACACRRQPITHVDCEL
jgi:hypothetical protein